MTLPPLRLRAVFWIVLLLAHGAAAWWFLPQIPIRADLAVDAGQDSEVVQALADEREFPSSHPILLVVPRTERARWEHDLRGVGLAVQSEASPGLSTDHSNPLFEPKSSGRTIVYVATQGDGQSEAQKVARLLGDHPGALVGGEAWSRRLMDQALARDVSWLFPASVVVIGWMFGWLVRRPGQAVWLTLMSTLPAIDVLLCYPLWGLPVDFTTILAPLLVLALTKKYNLWVHRHMEIHGPSHRTLVTHLGRAVLWSAALSSMGFATLLFSPLAALRHLAVLLWVGLGSALLWCLFIVPDLTRRWPGLAVGTSPRPHRWSLPSSPRWWLVIGVGVVATGSFAIRPASHWSDYLGAQSAAAQELAAFEAEVPTWQEAVLRLEGPSEEAWLRPGQWSVLESLEAGWRRQFPDVRFWSAGDLVPPSPDLAQELELLPPASWTGKLIDGGRRTVVIRLALPATRTSHVPLKALLDSLRNDALRALPSFQVRWSGAVVRQDRSMQAFLSGEAWGALGYFLVTGVLAMLVMRSVRRGALSMMPALGAAGVLLGTAGWLGWPFTPATALVAAACLGQCTDDGLLWGLLDGQRRIRRFFAEATLLLSAALAVLFLSTFANIQQAAGLVILALGGSTTLVLVVLPWQRKTP